MRDGCSSRSSARTPAEVRERAEALLAASGCLDGRVVADPAGAGGAVEDPRRRGRPGRRLARRARLPGVGDAAVPPANLGAYLREFDALLAEHGLHGLPSVISATAACAAGSTSRWNTPRARRLKAFVEDAGRLIARHGGSMSGERGDEGPARRCCRPCIPPRRWPCRAGEEPVRPRQHAQPGGARRSRSGRGGRPRARPCCRRCACRTRSSPATCSGAPASASASQHDRQRRGDVPVVPGHPRREGLHPRPGPGAAGDDQRQPGGPGLALAARCTRRSTCACPARAPAATAPPASTWRLTSRGCCSRRSADACGRRPTTPWAGCPGGDAWSPRSPASRRSPTPPPRPPASGMSCGRWPCGPAASDAEVPHPGPGAAGVPAPADRRRAGRPVGRLVHRHVRGLAAPGPGTGARGRRVRAAGGAAGRLLRAHLDHHRPARRRPRPAAPCPGRARPDRRAGHPDRRPRAELPRGVALGRRRAAARRTAGELGRRRRAHAGRTAGPTPGWTPQISAGTPSSPSRTATTRASSAGRPTTTCCGAPAPRS